jgi:predicted  nucleic acid-binding Zn-ribbon protein
MGTLDQLANSDLRQYGDGELEGLNVQLSREKEEIRAKQREINEVLDERAALEREAQALAEMPDDVRERYMPHVRQEVKDRMAKWASTRTN